MKRILIILTLIVLPFAMSAQNCLDQFFDKHSGQQGYQTLFYGKRMLDMMKEGAGSDVRNLLDRIRIIRIVSCDRPEDQVITIARRSIRNSCRYEIISKMNENGNLSEFYISEETGKAKDVSFVMIASSHKGSAVMEIVGKFDIKDISRLSVIGQKK